MKCGELKQVIQCRLKRLDSWPPSPSGGSSRTWQARGGDEQCCNASSCAVGCDHILLLNVAHSSFPSLRLLFQIDTGH